MPSPSARARIAQINKTLAFWELAAANFRWNLTKVAQTCATSPNLSLETQNPHSSVFLRRSTMIPRNKIASTAQTTRIVEASIGLFPFLTQINSVRCLRSLSANASSSGERQ